MKRTQIQLTEDQDRRLGQVANEMDTSRAEIVRRALEEWLRARGVVSSEEIRERARSVVGKYEDEATDVSERHDDYLTGSYQ